MVARRPQAPDPAQLRQIDWELAPFYCPDCGQNYCRADWHTDVLDDEGFYDCTMGICPSGHRYMVDDWLRTRPSWDLSCLTRH